jgi:fatty acid desaturase
VADAGERILFTREERSKLGTPRVTRVVVDLSLVWLQALTGCALFMLFPSLWTYPVAILLIGSAQHGLHLVAHECVHNLLVPGNRRLNDWIGSQLFAGPVMLPFLVFRRRHVNHHRFVSTQEDTKFVYRRDLRGWRFVLEFVRSLSMVEYLQQVVAALRVGRRGGVGEGFHAILRRDARAILAAQAVIFLAFLLFDPLWHGIPTYYVLLWLVPAVTTNYWVGKLRSVVEHHPFRVDTRPGSGSPYFMETPVPLLRSVRARWWERILLSKLNFHFHGEHHLWPWISYQHLPAVSERLWRGGSGRRTIDGQTVWMGDDYTTVLRSLARGE